MESIDDILRRESSVIVQSQWDVAIDPGDWIINLTREDFEGDYTLVVFPLSGRLGEPPHEIARILGEELVSRRDEFEEFNVVKGFVNLGLSDAFWHAFLDQLMGNDRWGKWPRKDQKVLVEFASPNTNKPLHLGHIRNILLGWSVAQLLDEAGYEVQTTQVINDRGIAICKSMLAWKLYGAGKTPDSEGMKGDHFVGQYYVLFEEKFKEEYRDWQQTDAAQSIRKVKARADQSEEEFFNEFRNEYFNQYSRLGSEARQMLQNWEREDPDTIALWERMNGWVYDGFEGTYERLGVSFDSVYYESETYKEGKKYVREGLDSGHFFRKKDGSAWVDLRDAGLDEKILLRSDGTAVYMTQDIGTAIERYEEWPFDRLIYVVADEQNYHFEVLFEILKRLDRPFSEGLQHLNYGMVDLPTGKMKSREGTVVDADDLMDEVVEEARDNAESRGELEVLEEDEKEEIIEKVGMAALKFFILNVAAQKRMVFDPKESVDLQGQTGPYIQNAYVRIRSIMRKAGTYEWPGGEGMEYTPADPEKRILRMLNEFPQVVGRAAGELDPSLMAHFAYNLAKAFHRFYHEIQILRAESEEALQFRLGLCEQTAAVLKRSMQLLGMEMPERM